MAKQKDILDHTAKILIAEDSPTQALKLRHLLETVGYQVVHVVSGEEAIACLEKEQPDLLISDILMPGMDGYALCHHVRNKINSKDIPVILLTTLSEPGEVMRGLECGANGFISKPYQDAYLLARVKDVLENHQLSDARKKETELKFSFENTQYKVVADRVQILEVLISTYGTVLQKNDELIKAQDQLKDLNESLEKIVSARTVQLEKEIEDRKLAEKHLHSQYELSKILVESLSLVEVSDRVFDIIQSTSDCQICTVWYEAQHGTVLHNVFAWVAKGVQAEQLVEFCKNNNFQRNAPPLGTVWTEAKSQFQKLDLNLCTTPKLKIAYAAGMRTWLGIPIVVRGHSVGVMEFLWNDERELDEQILAALTVYSVQLGEFIAKQNLQQQYFQAQKMESVGQLTGGMAHDFNNLLMIMQGNLELLLSQTQLDEKAKKYVATALAAIERGAEFNRRLLAFSRKQMLQPKVTEISELALSTVKLLQPTLGEAIEINTMFAEDLYPVYVDPGQFENVIVNLSVNARDAMNHKGKLTIEARNVLIDDHMVAQKYEIIPGPYVRISVTDTGSGIPPELLEKVFEPFFTTKAVGAGTGLGLSMVYGFVKQSKGYVTIYSELNQGTTINLYLPKADTEMIAETPVGDVSVLTGTETILVVEDEEALRSMVVEYLQQLGYQVLQATQAEEAMEILQAGDHKVQLLFTDVVTPGDLSGAEFAKAAQSICPQLKVLFTSGYPKSALQSKVGKGTVLEHFLAKPYKIHELSVKIREVLAGK